MTIDHRFLARMNVLRQQGHLSEQDLAAITSAAVASPRFSGLRRRRQGRRLAGICAGIAAWLGVETWLVRMLTMLAVLWLGSGVLLYLLAWIFVPLDE